MPNGIKQEEFLNSKILGKWLIILLPLAFAGMLLWPTYTAYKLDQERNNLAGDSAALEQWDIDNAENYRSARAGRLKLGLDLRGGMYVTLEVDVLKLIEESADKESVDEVFQEVLEKTAAETLNNDKDVLETFLSNFKATGKSLLAYFPVTTVEVTDEAVVDKLRRATEDAVDQALEVIKQRINKFEVSESAITKRGSRRILLELPDVKDEKEIRDLLQTTARLEFKRLNMGKELLATMLRIDKVLAGKPDVDEEATPVADTTAAADTTATADTTVKTDTGKSNDPYAGLSQEEAARRFKKDHPLSHRITIQIEGQSQLLSVGAIDITKVPDDLKYSLMIDGKDVAKVMAFLDRIDVRKAIPVDLDIAIGAKSRTTLAEQGVEIFEVYGLVREPDLTGDVVVEAFATFDPTNNQPVVNMQMNSQGAERWGQITGANIGKQIAIVLDGRVYSAPTVQNRIPNGSSQISGMGGVEEAKLLSIVLKAGALKAPVRIIEERIVGPSLGEDSISRGLTSTAISFAFIILFMLMYYAIGGGIADIALLMNVLLVVAVLAGMGGTLTLPGIAGVILAVAMAVDANILVFERMREELAAGKPLKKAVELGYSKAMSAIIDSNITNVLSGIVLYYLGSGPIKGFAVTLIIGVFMTLFTAVVVSRAMFALLIASGVQSINIGQRKNATA
jgi:SecD/SecF fusion protein